MRDKFNYKPKGKGYIPGEYDIRDRKDAGEPQKPPVDGQSSYLNRMSFKDMAYAKSITIKANPGAEATESADPYAIINSTNQVYEADYPGEDNTAGNTMPLLRNSSTSQLLNLFDCAKVDIILKYLYAAIDPTDINQALNIQLGKSMSEALSKAYSETYIQMPFFQDKITSSMINCDPANRTQAFVWYQTMLQNIATIPAKYNMLVSLEQHLKNSCYNRDVAPLDDLFGLLRKNAFRAKITAFSNIITGEYFDLTWFKQMNTLTMVPSRRTNSMRDPLLVIDACHDIPDLTITADGASSPYLTSDNYKIKILKDAGTPWDGETLTFQEAILNTVRLMSPYNVLTWARQLTNGIVSTTPTQYFNAVVTMIELIRTTLARFPSDVADIRTVLDVANRSGLNRWVRGVYFDVTREMFYTPVFNKLCNDVFTNYLASPNYITYDVTTLRWKFYSLWNEYYGIPKYDRVNGGSFLTFSTRQFETDIEPSTDTRYLIPKLFDIPSTGYNNVTCVNRLGVTADIGYQVYDQEQLAESSVYSRINALNVSDYSQRIPYANISTGFTNIPEIGSSIYYLMTRLFGLGNIEVSTGVTNESLNQEIVAAVDNELSDVSNAMIAFAQAYAPFKVYTPVKERTVGFKGVPVFGV